MNEEKKRRRDQRKENPAPMRLTERDIDIVEAIYQHRVMRQDQIQYLLFGRKNKSGAQRRLEHLFDHGYLERVFLPVHMGEGRSPTLYVLDRAGADLLRERRDYPDLVWHSSSKDIRQMFIEHALAINDVMIAVTLACQENGFELETWQGENQIKADYDRVRAVTTAGRRKSVPVVPDSYFAIVAHQRRHHFFLELDRGTMTIDRFKNKIAGYIAYHRSGKYEERYGTRSLRVLTITTGPKRVERLKQGSEEIKGQRRFWFAHLEDVRFDTILTAPIWQVATEDGYLALIEPPESQ